MPSVVAVGLLAACFGGARQARAETIHLKNGEKVDCVILLRGSGEIAVRDINGTVLTFPQKEVAHVDEATSKTEVVEGVSSLLTPESGVLAYHLGAWCLANDLKLQAEFPLRTATREPLAAARAHLALAALAAAPSDRALCLRTALACDLAFGEAEEAVRAEKVSGAAVPPEATVSLAGALTAVLQGRYSEAAAEMDALSRNMSRDVAPLLSARLFSATGFTLATLRARLGSAKVKSPPRAHAGPCKACGDTGYVDCPNCKGQGWLQCKECGGKGYTVTRSVSVKGTTNLHRLCAACQGSGRRQCNVCLPLPVPRVETVSFDAREPCTPANGTGRQVSGRSTVVCRMCMGRGFRENAERVTFRCTGSGMRRCMLCNADGHVPMPGTTALSRPRPARPAGDAATAPESMALLTTEEADRIDVYLALLARLAPGEPGASLRVGDKVPFTARVASAGPDEGLVWCCGKWVTPRMRDQMQRYAQALGYSARKPDLSGFRSWVVSRELEWLRKNSIPLGRGESAAAETRSLARLHSRYARAGLARTYAGCVVHSATFLPGLPAADATTALRWGVARDGQPSFVLLSMPSAWPATEVRLVSAAGSGVDLAAVTKTAAADPVLRRGQLSVYFRIAGAHGSVAGEADGARSTTDLIGEILAVTSGEPASPGTAWVAGLEALRD